MDFIQFVNSKDIRKYLYDIDYKLSVDQMIFVVLRCMFISVEKKIEALLEIKNSTKNVALTSIGKDSYFKELSGIFAYEFIDRYIDNIQRQLKLMKSATDDTFYEVRSMYEDDCGDFSHYAYFRTYDKCIDGIKSDRELLEANSFFEIIKHSFSNPEYIDSKCIVSRNFEVMELEVHQSYGEYDNDPSAYLYDSVQFISLPMPFKHGDIVKACCAPYYYRFRNNSNCVFIGYRPSKAEDFKSHRDGGDILFFAYYATDCGFGQSDGSPFSYELEYATPDPKNEEDQKLILLSDFIKGKLGPDGFYSALRCLELRGAAEYEKSNLSFLGIDSMYEFLDKKNQDKSECI